MSITQQPGLLTCNQSHDRAALYGYGYRWQTYQAWNQGRRGPLDTGGDYNLQPDRDAGISPGVWGVIYDETNFYSDAKGLAQRAVELGADHLMLDVENCLKGTYPDRAAPCISGCRDGGWLGPVHLTTLGAPEENPAGGFWDYEFDLDSFLKTGGGVFPQAYYAPEPTGDGRAPTLAADLTAEYYVEQESVDPERLNLMVWPNYNPIQVEIDLLLKAGLGCQMCVFMTEYLEGDPARYEALKTVTGLPPYSNGGAPEPGPEPPEPPAALEGTVIGSQHGISAMAAIFRAQWPDKTNPNRDPNNLSTWGAIDKWERTETIEAQDHDAWLS